LIRYHQPLYRPPSEARSLIFQATLGCSHNRCAFCVSFQGKRFRARKESELFDEIDWAGRELTGVQRVFLADGDAMALSTDRLLRILDRLSARLPGLRRVTAYATPMNFSRKSVAQLRRLREAGLSMIYVGLESGDDEVLRRIDKGCDSAEMIAACAKPHEAGIDLSVTVILGLAGPRLSERHARETARVIDAIAPRYASALTLMVEPREPMFQEAYGDPTWRLLGPLEILAECRVMIDAMDRDGIVFHANHASNYLPLAGELQRDKPRLLAAIDAVLAAPDRARLRPEFLRGL
jgi:radical SAM superfamily enzyme YgiQ (UPF0313 family)